MISIDCDIADAYEAEISSELVVAAARAALQAEGLDTQDIGVSIAITDDEEVRDLNRNFRGVDNTTDVLSFSAEEEPDFEEYVDTDALDAEDVTDEETEIEDEATPRFIIPPEYAEVNPVRYLGDIVISFPQAERQSAEFNNSPAREVQELVIHGIFHLLGYDHEEADQREVMRANEEKATHILDEVTG